MRLIATTLSALFLAGCAGAAAGTGSDVAPTPTVATTRIVTTEGGTVMASAMNVDIDVRLAVTGTADQAWAVLPGVYAELGIPLSVNDARTKTLGNTGWRTRRMIGRVPAQRYLECGSSGTLANAETYQLTLSIVSTVAPNARGGATVATTVTGSGKNPITSSSAEVRCASTGDLELRIRDLVERAIHAP